MKRFGAEYTALLDGVEGCSVERICSNVAALRCGVVAERIGGADGVLLRGVDSCSVERLGGDDAVLRSGVEGYRVERQALERRSYAEAAAANQGVGQYEDAWRKKTRL